MAVEPQSKRVRANNINIRYWDWGGNGPPIVMLHASGGFGRIWDLVARRLHPDYRVICPDQRGHGDSDKGDNLGYAAEDYAADLDALTRQIGLEKFVLVGHSLGSRAGIIFAAEHPDRISHLVMVAGPHYVSVVPSDIAEKESYKSRAQGRRPEEIRFGSIEEAVNGLRTANQAYRAFDEVALKHLATYGMTRNGDGSLTWKRNTYAAMQTLSHIPDDLTQYVKRITCPILIPWGKRDTDLTPERVEIVKPLFPTAQWVFMEKGSYYMYLEAPELLAKVIREYLAQNGIS